MQYYRQVSMCKQDHIWQVVFLPLELAEVGKIVVVDGDPDLWVIFSVADTMVTEDILNSWRKAWKRWEQVLK